MLWNVRPSSLKTDFKELDNLAIDQCSLLRMKAQNGLLCLDPQMAVAGEIFFLWYSKHPFVWYSPLHFVIYCLAFGMHSLVVEWVCKSFFKNSWCWCIQNSTHWFLTTTRSGFRYLTVNSWVVTEWQVQGQDSVGFPSFCLNKVQGLRTSISGLVTWIYSEFLFQSMEVLSWLGLSDSFTPQSRIIYWTATLCWMLRV